MPQFTPPSLWTKHLHVIGCVLLMLTPLCALGAKKSQCLRGTDAVACDVLIVGAGPGGAYLAYRLRKLGSKVCVAEAADYFGGRAYPIPAPEAAADGKVHIINRCPQRVAFNQIGIRCLANELNVGLQYSMFQTKLFSRGVWADSTQDFMPGRQYFGRFLDIPPTSLDLEASVYSYLFLNTTDVNPVTGATGDPTATCAQYAGIRQYMDATVGSEAAQLVMAGSGFHNELSLPIDVCSYIDFMKVDALRTDENFYPVGTWWAFVNAMVDSAKASGVRFFNSTPITCATSSGSGKNRVYRVSSGPAGIAFEAKRLVFAAPPLPLSKIKGSVASKIQSSKFFRAPVRVPVVTFSVFFPTKWWEPFVTNKWDQLRMFSDNAHCFTRLEIPGYPDVSVTNGTRLIYSDDPYCVAEFEALYKQGGEEAVYNAWLEEAATTFPNTTIPRPTKMLYYYQPQGWFFVQAFSKLRHDITNANLLKWAQEPIENESVCMVGDAWDIQNSGWALAAFVTADNCMARMFTDVITPADLDYFVNCNGTTTFSNEWFPPTYNANGPVLVASAHRAVPRRKQCMRC